MAQGRSTDIISIMKWIRTRRVSVKNSLSGRRRRWISKNPSGKSSYERPTRGTVCGTMRSICGADAGCLVIIDQSLSWEAGGALLSVGDCESHWPRSLAGLAPKPLTPTPSALIPKPQTLNPKTETLNPNPETRNPKP